MRGSGGTLWSRHHSCVLALLLLLATALPAQSQTLTDPALQLSTWAEGLTRPTQIDFLGPEDALVVEHTAGRVSRVVSGVAQTPPAFELGAGEGTGVLGIAIHHSDPPEVFLYIEDTTEAVGNRVNRYTWNAGLGVLDNETLLHQFPPGAPGTTHDGGVLAIGPTSEIGAGAPYLYVAAGDREGDGQLQNNPAGALPDDAGVILRIERSDGSAAPGNPFVPYCSATNASTCAVDGDCPGAETCVTEVAKYHAYGIRNIFGLAFDPITGLLWDTENGDTDWDEINLVTAGFNSGWKPLMGPGDPGSGSLFEMPGGGSFYQNPAFSWAVPTGPTGMTFAWGSTLDVAWDDTLLFGGFNQPGTIHALPLDALRQGPDFEGLPALQDSTADDMTELDLLLFGTGFTGHVLDVEMDPAGALYVVTYFDGRIFRITGPRPPGSLSPPVPGLDLVPQAGALGLVGYALLRRRVRAAARTLGPVC